jgi:secreted trypsin-like serine protease
MKTIVAAFIGLIVVVRGQGQFQCDVNAPCGCSPSTPTTTLSRIVGGENAQEDAWPWIVSIRDRTGDYCGGTILSARWILTATHCFQKGQSVFGLEIVAGSLRTPPSSSKAQVRSVAQIVSHPNYRDKTGKNDITLLRLRTPLNLTVNSVRPICLPSQGQSWPKDNTTLVAIGWGVTSSYNWQGPSILQQVTVRSINHRLFGCPSILNHPRQQFCAGLPEGGKGSCLFLQIFLSIFIVHLDTCQGDSGGPLMGFHLDRWYVNGITSYGEGCARPGHPGVYTRVSAYVPWINQVLKRHST